MAGSSCKTLPTLGTSSAVRWLRLPASNAAGLGLILGQRTKIPHAPQCSQKKKKKNTVSHFSGLHWKAMLALSSQTLCQHPGRLWLCSAHTFPSTPAHAPDSWPWGFASSPIPTPMCVSALRCHPSSPHFTHNTLPLGPAQTGPGAHGFPRPGCPDTLKTVQLKKQQKNCPVKNKLGGDFPGGPVVKNLPCNAGDVISVPGQGSKIPHAVCGSRKPAAAKTK